MFNYNVVYSLLGLEHSLLVQTKDEDSALAYIFELHPEAHNVKLWRHNFVSLPIFQSENNVIYVDFKSKKRIA